MLYLSRTLLVAVCTFLFALAGLGIQAIAPLQVIADGKPAIGAVAGLVTLLLALVLGLLVWTAFGVYTTQQNEAQTLGMTVLELDYLLEDYGSDANVGRRELRQAIKRARERYFGSREGPDLLKFSQARDNMRYIDRFFNSLSPKDEVQTRILAVARPMATSIEQTQLLMARQLSNPLPALLLVMVNAWSCFLFFCFGLTASVSWVSVGANALGSLAVASAIFMIQELSEPYSGLVRVSPEGIDSVLADLEASMSSSSMAAARSSK